MTTTDVLIVGAGPAGLTLACDIARRNVSVRLIEALPAPSIASKGKGLQPRTQEVFRDLGIVAAAIAAGRPYPPLAFHEGERIVRTLAMMTDREPSEAIPYPNILMLPQWKTEELLRDRFTALGGTIEYGIGLVGFEQDADGVTAMVSTAEGEETIAARYIVGTDGGRSTVRRALGVALGGDTPALEGMLVGDVRVPGLDREHWHVWGPSMKENVTLCPLPATESFQFTATLRPDEQPTLELATYQAYLDARAGETAPRLEQPTWMSVFRPNLRMVDRFRVGRAFLVGDAAHIHPPAGAQGLNTSVQDAYNLGWKLAEVLAGGDDAILATYEEERLPIAAVVLGRSELLYRGGLAGDDAALRRADDEHQLLLNYRGSPLAEPGDATLPLQAGDRMPNAALAAPGGGAVELFDLMQGPHWTVLAIDTELPAAAPTAAPCRSFTVSTGGGTVADYVATGDVLAALSHQAVTIRPDGYIARIA